MVNLGDLGSASSGDVRKALEGQPSPVQDDAVSETPDLGETPEPTKSVDADAALGNMSSNVLDNEDGTFTFVNPYDSNLDVDLDQFETKRRRVSEDSMLSGILNGVEGLEQNFVYTGLEDTANRSEEAQGVVNKMKNGMTQLVADTAINVGQGFASLLYGVPSAIVNGDLTKLYDNSVANSMDRGSEFLDEFYKIKRGGNQSGVQKAANFLFDDLAGGASFVMGAIATEMAFTALTAVTFGGAAPAQAAASVGLVARGTRLVQKALQGGKALMAGTLVDDALRASRALGAKTTRQAASQALRNAGQAIKTPMAMQAAARVSRQLITGASMESGMEARHMLNAAVENQKHQYEEIHGAGSFTDEMSEAFREDISGYADGVFGANMALVGASNMLMFPKLFGVGLRRGMKTSKFIDTSKLSQKARQRLAKNLGVAEGKLPRMVDAARGNTFGRIVGRTGQTGRVTAANLKNALYEGFVEEGGQGAISRSTEDYISKKYDPAAVNKTVRYVDSFMEGLKGSYTTKDGFKEIGIGMLLAFTGVPMYAKGQKTDADGKPIEGSEWKWRMMGGYADQRQALLAQDKKMDAIVALNEKHGDVGGILKAEAENFNRQNALQAEQDEAVAAGNFKEAKDVESEMIFSHAAAKIVTGRYDQSIAEYEQLLEEMSPDEFREQYGDPGKNMTDAEVQQRKSDMLAKHKTRMENARQAYEMAQEVYRGEDPDITTGVAHMLYMTAEKDAREIEIAEKMADAIEGMNGNTVLDLVRAQQELDLTDEQLGEILKRINRNKDIEKQLKTKLERKIIKNVDPVKAEQRQKEVEALQQEQQDNLDFMQEMMDTMATANNVDRGKYDFSPEFLDDLSKLHFHISRQANDVTFQKQDIEQMHADMLAIAADRMELIANYNDFISPGGVARFEARMIGSIERLADKSVEERQEQAQQEANAQDADAFREEVEGTVDENDAAPEVNAPQEADPTKGKDPVGVPTDDSQGPFEPPAAADPSNVPTGENLGFPDPTPDVPNVTQVPAGVGLDDAAPVEPRQEGVTKETPPKTQQPAKPAKGVVKLGQLVNHTHADDRNRTMVREDNQPVVAKVYPGVPVGTKLVLTSDDSGIHLRFADGSKLRTYKSMPKFVEGYINLDTRGHGSIELETIGPVTRDFRGGERTTMNSGQESKFLEVRVSKVLPNGAQDITGFALATKDSLMPIEGQQPLQGSQPSVMQESRAGSLYISTKDARGVEAWHAVRMGTMGKSRAKQILDFMDAYNQYVVDMNSMTPEQTQLVQSFMDANNIRSTGDPKVVTQDVLKALRRMVPSDFLTTQIKKAENDTSGDGNNFFAFETTKSGRNTIGLIAVSHDPKTKSKVKGLYSHSVNGDTNRTRTSALVYLANTPLNVAVEGSSAVPDGKGGFTNMDTREIVQEFGRFSDRMPVVSNGKFYNEIVTEIPVQVKDAGRVPTGERTIEREAPAATPPSSTSADVAELGINLDTLDFDVNDLDFGNDVPFSPLMSEAAEDGPGVTPMERAGVMYDIPGLTSQELRDGINFGAGVMSRSFMTHMRTKDRNRPIKASYLRRYVRTQLEGQLAQLEAANAQNPNANYQRMIEAHRKFLSPEVFDRLVDLSMVELLRQSKGIITPSSKSNLADALNALNDTQQDGQEAQEEQDAERSENPMAAFDDNFAFGVNPNSTLRMEAKMLLQGLVDKNNNSAQSVGLAGRRFLNVQDLMGKLNAELAGVDPDFISVELALTQGSLKYPQFAAVIDALSDQAAISSLPAAVRENEAVRKNALALQDMIRNQFTNYAVKEITVFDSVRIVRQKRAKTDNPMDQGTPADIQIFSSNERNMRRHVQDDIRSVLIQHGFFNVDGSINKERFAELHKGMLEMTDLPQADQAQALSKFLSKELGINVPAEAFTPDNPAVGKNNKPLMRGIDRDLNSKTSYLSAYGKFRKAVKDVGDGKLTLERLLSDPRGAQGAPLIDFFVGLADYQENFIQNSSKDGSNKTRWHYSAPKLLHQMLRVAKDNAYDTSTNAPVLAGRFRTIGKDKSNLIGLSYVSGIKQDNQSKERGFHDMEPGDRVMAMLAFYGNRNKFTRTSTRADKQMVSKFLMPTLADKQTMPVLQAPAMSAKLMGLQVNAAVKDKAWEDWRVTDFLPNIQQAYKDSEVAKAVDKEADRILRIHAADFQGMTAAQRQAKGFVLMPGLNHLADQLMEGKISRKDFKAKVAELAPVEFENALNEDLQYMLRLTKGTAWFEDTSTEKPTIGKLEHFNANKPQYKFVANHVAQGLDVNQGGMHIAVFGAFLAKYAVDSMGVRTGVIMDVMGDPGAFVKANEAGINISKTNTNLGKRLASLIAPGNAIPMVKYLDRNGRQRSNATFNVLVMPARVVDKAAHYDYLKKLGQSPDQLAMQEGYDSADAAEYTTVEEHLGILYAEGKITKREMAGLLGKIKRGEKFTPNEMQAWFQPMKPVTTGRVGDHMIYIKSASFPLVPQLTQGTELDKLRVFMEDNNIERAAYDSAVKLGNQWDAVDNPNATEAQKMVEVHKGDAVETSDELAKRVIRGVDRKFMRIQQQVPVSKAKEKVHGSQVAKLLLSDLLDATFDYNGKKIKGTELYAEYMSARKEEQQLRLQQFAERYGMQLDPKGNLVHTAESRKKLAARLIEEANSLGYDPNEMAHLYFNEQTGRFETPLEAGPSQERIENLLKSIAFKEIYSPTITGFGGPIRPEVGMKSLDDEAVNKSDIMWVKKGGKRVFDGKKLKVAKGKQADQIIMPWKYKAKLDKYLDEDGNINADDLPAELLQTFAYRIPSQRKSSSAAFEIVGFLPEQYGDTLIVNEELVGRIGQDYDIDKMFGFLYAVEQAEDGSISVIRNEKTKRSPVKRVISGGQTGADRIGLEVASDLKIPTGGVAPANFKN